MSGNVYAKTGKGREEIATRKFGVPARIRALLLMIDGQRSLAALASKLGPPAQTIEHAAWLLEAGFIELVAVAPVEAVAVAPVEAVVQEAATPAPVAVSAPVKVSMHDIYSSRGPQRR